MSQGNVEIATRSVDAFNRRDVDALLDLVTPDCVMSSQLLDASADFQGREGVERFYTWFTDFASPDTLAAFCAKESRDPER